MNRDRLTRRGVLSAVLAVSLVAWLTAFRASFQSTLAYQQRDSIGFSQESIGRDGDTLRVVLRARNPLSEPVVVTEVELVVYEDAPPLTDDGEIGRRRTERLVGDRVVIPETGTDELVGTAEPVDDEGRVRESLASGSAVVASCDSNSVVGSTEPTTSAHSTGRVRPSPSRWIRAAWSVSSGSSSATQQVPDGRL